MDTTDLAPLLRRLAEALDRLTAALGRVER